MEAVVIYEIEATLKKAQVKSILEFIVIACSLRDVDWSYILVIYAEKKNTFTAVTATSSLIYGTFDVAATEFFYRG